MRRRRVYDRRSVPVVVDRFMVNDLVAQGFLQALKPRDWKSGGRRVNDAIGEAMSKWLRVRRQYGGG
jgi:hypothetical protein